jgi:polyisoprenoid-binding protein YceI
MPGRERPFRAEGELTMLGVTRPVQLSVERFGCTVRPPATRRTCGADMVTTISRAAFGMTGYAAIIGDEVRLELQFEAIAD